MFIIRCLGNCVENDENHVPLKVIQHLKVFTEQGILKAQFSENLNKALA